jgi:phosphate:Na+ symporter
MSTPSIALGQATKEITRMANLTAEMLDYGIEMFAKPNSHLKKQVERREDAVDNLAAEITRYLSKVSQQSLSPEQSRRLIVLMHTVNDVERIGDHAENIMQLGELKSHERAPFSKFAHQEMKGLYSKVESMYKNMIVAFKTDDKKLAKKCQEYEDVIDTLVRDARIEHIRRLSTGVCSPTAGVIFLDLISNLERVGDLANNLGYATRGEMGKL